MIPDNTREPDQWELVDLERHGSSVELVGEKKFSFILWYEKTKIVTKWYAQRRGIYSTDGWRMRTGDGFGLTQVERPVAGDKLHWFAVYPQIVDVNPDLFLRNVWNAETGTRGVMEDPTVIRSSREYALTDSMKRINWRLAARGLPLAVNVYEEILPKNVHFIFDGESFGGPDPHYREMEEALSIIASEILRLEEADVKCGISFCSGRVREAANIFDFASTEEKLFELAAYAPKAQAKDENNHIIKQLPIFDEAPILSAKHKTGRFYYVAYDTEDLSKVNLLHSLDNSCVSILTYTESATYGEFETVCLSRLKEGKEDVR